MWNIRKKPQKGLYEILEDPYIRTPKCGDAIKASVEVLVC